SARHVRRSTDAPVGDLEQAILPRRARIMTLVATSLAGPGGSILVAATDNGVAAVELMTTRDAFSDGLERRLGSKVGWVDLGAPPERGPDRSALANLRAASDFLVQMSGSDHVHRAPDQIPLDLADRPAWDQAVLGAVRAIPWGETRSYGDVARAIGRPGAARAVGGAVGRNPIAMIIPCHRVIAGDGTLGGYGGGWWGDRERLLDLKAELLAAEGRIVRRRAP
ncbi:MAG: MGMT family protein, partial [Candidatus Limnocylindrales bacterium]